jgi:subtilisin family serine protease
VFALTLASGAWSAGDEVNGLRLVAPAPAGAWSGTAGLEPAKAPTAGVIVELAPGVSAAGLSQVDAADAVPVQAGGSGKDYGRSRAVYRSSTLTTAQLIERLRRLPGVARVSPNNVNSICATPSDSRFAELWGLNNTGAGGGLADADIDAPEAWDLTTGNEDVVVAVIDSGVAYTHPDLAGNMWVNPGEVAGDGLDNDGNGYVDDVHGIDAYSRDSDPWDEHGHGTHVAGTVAAVGDNSRGVAGVAWRAKVMALRFLGPDGSGDDAGAIECIEYAVDMKRNHGVNVVAINASWGTYGPYDAALADAIQAAGDAGIVFCAAAGNGAADLDKTPWYPASYASTNIISVGATDNSDQKADFGGGAASNYGAKKVDLFAPGKNILSTFPAYPLYYPDAGDPYFDDMEAGAGNWIAQSPWALTGEAVLSGAWSWSDSPSTNYANNADVSVSTRSLDLHALAAHGAVLGFAAAFSLQSGYDFLYVEASGDGGASWVRLGYLTGTNAGGYYNVGLPGSVLTGQTQVRFRLVSDKTVTADGVYLDDVGIASVTPAEYLFLSGTSMAAPHVSGTVALLASLAPSESAGERVGRILSSVDRKASLAGLCLTGGRLNAAAALAASSAAPTVTSLSPNTGPVGGGTQVVISGNGFLGASAVTFGDAPAAYTVDSPDRITATAPPHAAGVVRVVVATAAGTSSDTAADDFTYVAAVTPPATSRVEQTDSRLVWSGTWTTSSSTSYSGGSHRYANVSGASVTAVFSGTYLAWIAKTSPVYGKAKVTVDGTTTYLVDLYSAATGYKKKVWDSGILPSGLHTVRIEWTGQKSVSTGGTNISVDAFDVAGTLKSATRYEQTDSRLKWSGTWTTASSTSYSGGSFRYANASGSKVTIEFTGVRLTLIAKKASNYGIARVSLDGGVPVSVDFYSSTTLYKQKVWSTPFLVPGNHTVTITWTGTKRSAATATNINLDAVDVIGSLR